MEQIVCLIPARSGSKRLRNKNLLKFANDKNLVELAIEKALKVFEKETIYLSTDSEAIALIGDTYGINVFKRSKVLSDDKATSEDYISDFLQKVSCRGLVQVHTITPLLDSDYLKQFISLLRRERRDALYTISKTTLECFYNGDPLNFSPSKKTNSQELESVSEVNWSFTYWDKEAFLKYKAINGAGTWLDNFGFLEVPRSRSFAIKTEEDFQVCQRLYSLSFK